MDSHLALPVVRDPLSILLATALPPFQALFSDPATCATVMTGHIALPLVTGDDTPSSLSRAITTDLLRDKMGFKEGVIVTDCLEMEAVVQGFGSEGGAVLALKAGADIVMICHTFERHRGAVEATWDAVQKGEWSEDDIQASAQRVRALKDKFAGSWEDATSGMFDHARLEVLKKEHTELSRKAYAAAIALIRGPLPKITGVDHVLVLTPEIESLNKAVDDAEGVIRAGPGAAAGRIRNTAGPSYLSFAASIAARVPSSKHIVYSRQEGLNQDDVRAADVVIFVTRNADQSPWQTGHLESVLGVLGDDKDIGKRQEGVASGIVVLQSCAPYDLLSFRGPLAVPSLACFEFTPPAFEAAVKVLFGEAEASGTVPVLGGAVDGKS